MGLLLPRESDASSSAKTRRISRRVGSGRLERKVWRDCMTAVCEAEVLSSLRATMYSENSSVDCRICWTLTSNGVDIRTVVNAERKSLSYRYH